MLPHHTSFSESSCRTICLSFGLRPVFAPDRIAIAPVETTPACSRVRASSYNRAGDAFRTTTGTVISCGLKST